VQIGAILTLAGGRSAEGDFAEARSKNSRKSAEQVLNGSSYVLLDVLGQSLLDRTIERLQKFGTAKPTVIHEGPSSNQVLPWRSAKSSAFIAAWEGAVEHYVQRGTDILLLLRVRAYTDLDYNDLLKFHLETQSPLTQAYAPDGSLDLVLVDVSVLRQAGAAYRRAISALIPQQRRFMYAGYVNRLRRPQDFFTLVQDGLNRRCHLRPVGTEVRPDVWYGFGAHVESTAVISAPVFLGASSKVAACCTITGASSIERNCEIDCGTVVHQSCVLQNTYIGVALDVRHSIVNKQQLFHLERNVEVNIGDRRLIGTSAKAVPFLSGVGSFAWGEP
jgi:hypothetical protein